MNNEMPFRKPAKSFMDSSQVSPQVLTPSIARIRSPSLRHPFLLEQKKFVFFNSVNLQVGTTSRSDSINCKWKDAISCVN